MAVTTAGEGETIRYEVKAFHNVFNETDLHASTPETIDLACVLVAYTGARTIVEAGTYRGHMAMALGNILRMLGSNGKVYTADPIDVFSLSLAHPTAEEIRPYIHFHVGDFREMLADVPDPIDFAYIDASVVENPHLRLDHMTLVYKRMRPGGLILVDDTEGDWPDATVFQHLRGLHLKQRRGLTIIQKDY